MRIKKCKPGPAIGKILDELLERVLDEPGLNTPEQLESIIRTLNI
jgi:hypothetical protein